MFQGAATALITPFDEHGVDFDSLGKLLDAQIAGGIDALLICGTTGEPSTMTDAERASVIEYSVARVRRRVPLIVGTGTNCTATAIRNSVLAQQEGADGILVVTPYYNKCTQEGLYLHYRAICDSVSIPVIAYNIPSRTGVNILPETAARLATIPNLCGLKEACGDLEQISRTAQLLRGTQVALYSGDDALASDVIEMGGKGVISVASNLIPDVVHELATAGVRGDRTTARAMQSDYDDLFRNLFCEVNPIPIKYACSLVGLCKNYVRMPLTPITPEGARKVEQAMRAHRII